jgi:hypothetical protein
VRLDAATHRPGKQLTYARLVGANTEDHALAFPRTAHETLALEYLKVPGRAGLREPDLPGDRAHAALAPQQRPNEAEARCVAQTGEDLTRPEVDFIHCMKMHITGAH